MQLESSQHQLPFTSSGADGGVGAAPHKGSLSVLVDGDMSRFGEFFDGSSGISASVEERSRHSSFAESSQHLHQQPVEHQEQQYEQRHEQFHHHRHEHLHGYAPSSDSTVAPDGADWACSALIEDGSMIAYPPESSIAFAAGDYSRDADAANYSVPYFGVPCWIGDHVADGLTPLPIDSDPNGNNNSHSGGFGHFHMDPLEHGKDASSSSLDAPSPAHMEHFMPFVHHGEPEMIFAGMDLSHAELQSWHMSHQALPHQLEHDQQHPMFFPGCAPSDEGDLDQFIPHQHQHQQHNHNHHQAMLQFDGSDHSSAIIGLHDKTQPDGEGASPWSAAGFHAPPTTHFVKSGARKNSLCLESGAGAATLKAKTRTATAAAPSQRVLRGRSSASALVTPLPPAASPAMSNGSVQQKTKSSSPFQAELRLVTVLNDCYWKNGRKNLQCFPVCPEHNDFYSMKMNNRKHSSVGVCRGPVYCHVIAKAAQPLRLGSTGGGGGGGSDAGGSQSASSSSSSSSSSRRSHGGGIVSNIHASCAATLPFIPSGQHMKYEHGVGASGSGGSSQELFVLGRFERVPQRDNTDLVEELGDPPEFSSSVAFETFRYSCFQAVEMKERRTRVAPTDRENLPHKNKNTNGNTSASEDNTTTTTTSNSSNGGTPLVRSTWFFLPDVWKVQPMLKKKRKATRSAPAQTFPFCFRVFVYTADDNGRRGGGGGYTCVSSTASSFFELYSTRTVDRVKRKYWSKSSDAAACAGAKRHARG